MTALIIISIVFTLAYTMLILYYSFIWQKLPTFNLPPSTFNFQPSNLQLSIIIPARNEEKNIGPCLESILGQNYPRELYEIIVADDYSDDGTAAVVSSYENVKLISLKDHVQERLNSYKKKAIEVAVAQAKGQLIITTDADCIAPPHWLQTISSFYEKNRPAFIAMPVSIAQQNRFIEIFQSLDFMTLQGVTAAAVSKKQMTMCNGANMAYERSVFYEVGGFKGIDKIASGDDMLLMNKIFRKYPGRVMYLQSAEVIMQTAPVQNISQFMQQRIRWASKSDKYDDKRILPVLMLVYLFNCLLLLLPVIALFNNKIITIGHYQISPLQAWLVFLVIKTVAELIFLFPVAKFFSKTKLLFWFPFMQPFHIIYTVIAGWLGKFGTYRWKGRTVR